MSDFYKKFRDEIVAGGDTIDKPEGTSNRRTTIISTLVLVGFFAWLFTKLSNSLDDGTNVRKMKVYDKFLFPISKALDAMGLRYLFGKNLLVYCTKLVIRD